MRGIKLKKESNVDETKKRVGSPVLERYIQQSMNARMQNVDEKVIAQAIKTLLHQEKNKHLN